MNAHGLSYVFEDEGFYMLPSMFKKIFLDFDNLCDDFPYRGFPFVQLPSPEPKAAGEFTVIRITADRLTAIPFNYRDNKWSLEKHKVLDTAIKGPVQMGARKKQPSP